MPGHLEKGLAKFFDLDLDAREDAIRKIVCERMAELETPDLTSDVVATYFVVSDGRKVHDVGRTISYHQTTAEKHPEPGSLVERCTGKVVDSDAFTADERIGIVRVAFPLAMFLDDDGRLFSTDLLHVTAGAGVFALREFKDIKLVDLALGKDVIATFPGPAFGPDGVRKLAGFENDVAFGTIIKPCTGITPEEVASTVAAAAEASDLFLFIKEDEELLPNVPFCPLKERVRLSQHAIEKSRRGEGSGIIYAPHVGSNPGVLLDNVRLAVEMGARGIMFSEYYLHGCLRLVRDALQSDGTPVVIYGHNGGISVHTRHIWREVLDFIARLDGMDIRQTSVMTDNSLLRPSGREWRNVEEVLTKPVDGIKRVMIARAGGLDQGNIVPNLDDVERGTGLRGYLMLAGSAINSYIGLDGKPDPKGGSEAMRQALQAFRDSSFDNSPDGHLDRIRAYAKTNSLGHLTRALAQRYGG